MAIDVPRLAITGGGVGLPLRLRAAELTAADGGFLGASFAVFLFSGAAEIDDLCHRYLGPIMSSGRTVASKSSPEM